MTRGLAIVGLLGVASVGWAALPVGYQPGERVRQATRLDWEWLTGTYAPEGGKVSAAFDPRAQRYALYVPPAYRGDRAWPLVLFVPPGDDPLGWPAFEKLCTSRAILFA